MKAQKRIFSPTVFTSLFICGIILFWGFQVSGQEWTDAQKKLWKVTEAYWENIILGDVEAITALGAEGNLEWFHNRAHPSGNTVLKTEYEGWFSWHEPVSYELEPLIIHIFGNVANVFYLYKWKGKKTSRRGRQMSTYIKQDNKWKHIGGMGASCEGSSKCMWGVRW